LINGTRLAVTGDTLRGASYFSDARERYFPSAAIIFKIHFNSIKGGSMLKKGSIYKCETCGNLIEGLWNGTPDISCCGMPMKELIANTTDAAKEKHVPVIVRNGTKVTVKVGEVAHPMTPQHYILFVELIAGDIVLRHDFKEGDAVAEAVFTVEDQKVPLQAREFCNLHGLWGTK
jgi:superoxide reductase